MLDLAERKQIIALMQREVVPAIGCTEPVAVALCVAKATETLGCLPEHILLYLSANILKNAMGVGIPGTGMIGLPIAVALGALIGKSEYQLEVLKDSTPEAVEKGIELIKEGKYDFLVIYNQEYDDSIHFTHPKSFKAKRALDHYAESFERIGKAVAATGVRTLLGYAPDHGVHREWYLLGNHGKDIPKDMEISHFYHIYN